MDCAANCMRHAAASYWHTCTHSQLRMREFSRGGQTGGRTDANTTEMRVWAEGGEKTRIKAER